MSNLENRLNKLGHYPTPLEKWDKLGSRLGCELWAKRDDLIGLAFGGNKTRKLEYLTHAAEQEGADWLVTTGAPQSNHCRQTAAAAAKLGFGCTLLLGGPGIRSVTGNLLLDYIMGAEVEWTTSDMHARNEMLGSLLERLREKGRRPYLIPLGGSNHWGTFAFVKAMEELKDQLEALEIEPPDVIVTASSSGGTQAGLALGTAKLGWSTQVLGVSVDMDEMSLRTVVTQCMLNATKYFSDLSDVTLPDLWIDDCMAEFEYAAFTDDERALLVEVARAQGVLLDPVY
ncbi:MAG: pyridoxal-phosphate dependent enzyme, partial [Myxococcota bacterium]|nr:pyridoxal-phosphate dependent enzyme [Myxococcota bacterium]